MLRRDVYVALNGERSYQQRKWGHRQLDGTFTDQPHTPSEFILYMEHYLHEARSLISTQNHNDGGMEMLRKVVGLGINCFEQHGCPVRQVPVDLRNERDGQPA